MDAPIVAVGESGAAAPGASCALWRTQWLPSTGSSVPPPRPITPAIRRRHRPSSRKRRRLACMMKGRMNTKIYPCSNRANGSRGEASVQMPVMNVRIVQVAVH